ALVIGASAQNTFAATITSATLPDVGTEQTITDFVAGGVGYKVTNFATVTDAPNTPRFYKGTDAGTANAALSDGFVTTGLVNTQGFNFDFDNASILAASVFFVMEINGSGLGPDDFTFQAIAGDTPIGSAFVLGDVGGNPKVILDVFDGTFANPPGAANDSEINGSTFTLADFNLTPLELTQVTGVRLVSTGGGGDPALVGLANAIVPEPSTLALGIIGIFGICIRRRGANR
ncbi:MAG: PEP-CTERM sorting domain-containing protein, partial [Pirellulales bacterium]|nr:PEP-CTERM sorting domain-containing protein [Pirellulales bacterium]